MFESSSYGPRNVLRVLGNSIAILRLGHIPSACCLLAIQSLSKTLRCICERYKNLSNPETHGRLFPILSLPLMRLLTVFNLALSLCTVSSTFGSTVLYQLPIVNGPTSADGFDRMYVLPPYLYPWTEQTLMLYWFNKWRPRKWHFPWSLA